MSVFFDEISTVVINYPQTSKNIRTRNEILAGCLPAVCSRSLPQRSFPLTLFIASAPSIKHSPPPKTFLTPSAQVRMLIGNLISPPTYAHNIVLDPLFKQNFFLYTKPIFQWSKPFLNTLECLTTLGYPITRANPGHLVSHCRKALS